MRRLGVAALACIAGAGSASAFPQFDPNNPAVPVGTALPEADAKDLRRQLEIVNGITKAGGGGGWIVLPRLSVQEMFTDNVLQVNSPRRWDLATIASPGVTVIGDTARVQVRLDYAPALALYARTGSQNALTHQLNSTGLVTLVPERAFVDVRALAGVQSLNGGVAGLGGIGASGIGPVTAGSFVGQPGNTLGISKQNLVQTTSASVSPYLLSRFGDYGTGKLGAGVNVSRFSSVSGFSAPPWPTGTSNAQTQVTTEQVGNFTSGEILGRLQNSVNVYLSQTSTSAVNGSSFGSVGATTSSRETVSNQLAYALSRSMTIFGSLGYENIQYNGGAAQKISGMTWNVGGTLHPNPDSHITLSYGRQEGADAFAADASYAVTARTSLTIAYSNQLGTQLQNLQRQLDFATVNSGGSLVSGATGGPLFVGNNALGVQPGLYRFENFTATAQTLLDRDQIILGLAYSAQTGTGANAIQANASTVKTASLQWLRQLRPDLSMSTYFAYSLQTGGAYTGNNPSLAASAALQYTFNESLTGIARYTYFERTSSNPTLNLNQSLVILGLTKQF